jgi:hypothetical protein
MIKLLIFNLIISKPISLVELALVCLEIPIVQKSQGIKYIDSKLPLL